MKHLNDNDFKLIVLGVAALIFLIYLIYHHKDEDIFDGVDMTSYESELDESFNQTFESVNVHDETVED